ncbi:transcription initiation factor IIB family protein [Halorubrum sp. CGM5_25_10-8B]|uniref:transcription initiation factor IIB n=1 Tax=Halorubrum sp. CGM5_25_10-8B TaxID=2518115 RepID=UPI0010F6C667|nr:transcription initiation factor IIB family protein [Halorubrum sp. CGM5_25_10-8B]TKX37138.1 transcription initiation factor IIB family protein [Halorubrum sp. CGM5_25_10-8B]
MNERTNEERLNTVSRRNGTDEPSSSETGDGQSVSNSVSEENGDERHSQTTCPECHGRLRRADDEVDTVCDDCGLVVSDARLDTNIKLYTPNGIGNQDSRVGPASTNLLHDKGLSTVVGWQNTDANGNSLSGERRQQMRRLRRWDERFRRRSSADRNLMHALGEIDRMASALGVPDSIRETGGVIYRRALDNGLLPGRAVESVATAALYAASRIDGVPRSIGEVSAVSRVEQIRVERAYRQISRELGLEIAPTDPRSFIGRIASDVGCTDTTEQEARRLAGIAVENGVHSGKHPVGIAAGSLYAAAKRCDESLRQADVAHATDVSEMTIRNRYPEILAAADTEDE